jgi:hypothetical protein
MVNDWNNSSPIESAGASEMEYEFTDSRVQAY